MGRDATILPHRFDGVVRVPASKSHTIRQLLIAALAEGESRIVAPLESLDAASCVRACSALGARITEVRDAGGVLAEYVVRGTGGGAGFAHPRGSIDVGNSGTTLFLGLAVAALGQEAWTFTGDEQIQRRSAAPLLNALRALGVEVADNKGCAPLTVRGPWKGGSASIECPTSQYLSALLIAAPLAAPGARTRIEVPLLYEKPYVEMTLSYLRAQGVRFDCPPDFSWFCVEGGQRYAPLNGAVPADFSSAAFPALAAVVSGGCVQLTGLDPHDTQGDKAFFDMLSAMGAQVRWEKSGDLWTVRVAAAERLLGGTFDLNNTPDMLPAACVLGAYACGQTALVNVANARIKETDRIAVMAAELSKMGVVCRELPDGIVLDGRAAPGTALKPADLDGHGDHRVVMALACAALGAAGGCRIAGAEAADVTYPGFLSLLTDPRGPLVRPVEAARLAGGARSVGGAAGVEAADGASLV